MSIIRKLLLSNPKLATKILKRKGDNAAIKAFKDATNVTAYSKFLKEQGVNVESINSIDDFNDLPITDKANYIKKYSLDELVKCNFDEMYTIERSSGYTGSPHYWPRYSGQDDGILPRLEILFDMLFQTKSKSTLIVNTFALGTWLAGTKFARLMLEYSNNKNNKATSINIGINLNETLEMLMRFHMHYDQVLIGGYNPFLKQLIEKMAENNFPFEKTKVHLLMGGEACSEEWRDYVAGLMGYNIDEYDAKIVSGYGAADLGKDIGFEQPISLYLRRFLMKNPGLVEELFGKQIDDLPMIFQYSPTGAYLEEVDGEIIVTANSVLPVIRYNIHDSGGLLSYDKVMNFLSKHDDWDKIKERFNPSPLPFVYVFGRSDGTLHLLGLNIYIQNLQSTFAEKDIQEFLTGRFHAHVENDEKMNQILHITCEARDLESAKSEYSSIVSLITKYLSKYNSEYAHAYKTNPDLLTPVVNIVSVDEFNNYQKDSIKVIYKK